MTHTMLRRFCDELLQHLLLLSLLAIAALQPTLSGIINIGLLVFLKLGKKLGDATDRCCLAVLGRIVGCFNPSQGWSRRKQREQVGGKLVCHCALSS